MEHIVYLLPYILSLLISLGIGFYAWQRQQVSGVAWFAVYALGQAFWAFGYLLELISPDLTSKLFWDNLQTVGGVIAFVASLPFVLEFTKHPWANSRRLRLFLIISLLIVEMAIITNPLHSWMQGRDAEILPIEPYGALTYTFTTGIYLVTLYAYAVFLTAVWVLIRQTIRAKGIYRAQLIAILCGFLVYTFGILVAFGGVQLSGQRDVSPLASAIGNMIIAWGLFRYHLFDLVPVAREVVIENMISAVVVLDLEERIVDINPAALKLISGSGKNIIGQALDTVFPSFAYFIKQNHDHREMRQELKINVNQIDTTLEATLSTLEDNRKRVIGRLLMLNDITERVLTQNAIAALTDETERLYLISREMNGVQTYPQIIDAIAKRLNEPSYGIGLFLYEGSNKDTARHFEIVSLRNPFVQEAILDNQRFDASVINVWTAEDLFVVENTQTDPRLESASTLYFQNANIQSMMVARLMFGKHIIGALLLSSPTVGAFAESEKRFLQAVADLTVTAMERTRLYQEQVKLAEELQRVDQLKSQFLASMSHELRTPLNAVLNFTEFVANGIFGTVNDRQVEALGKAHESGKHLLTLINDVLDVAKIQAGKMQLLIEPDSELTPEINIVVASIQPALEGKPVKLLTDIDDLLPIMAIDRRRVRQVILNLLSNAVKFTQQGSITLSVKNRSQDVLIAVLDTGPGIGADEQKALFEPFKQTGVGLHQGSGTGLGLYISRQLVEAHGGRLWVESEPGQGAAFFFTLPVV